MKGCGRHGSAVGGPVHYMTCHVVCGVNLKLAHISDYLSMQPAIELVFPWADCRLCDLC